MSLAQLSSQKLTNNYKSIVNSFPLKKKKKKKPKVHKSNLSGHVYKLQTIDSVEGERGQIYTLSWKTEFCWMSLSSIGAICLLRDIISTSHSHLSQFSALGTQMHDQINAI